MSERITGQEVRLRASGFCTFTPSWRPPANRRKSGTRGSRRTCRRAARAGRTSRGCWPPSAAGRADRHRLLPALDGQAAVSTAPPSAGLTATPASDWVAPPGGP